jgi:hypothetical protein
MTEEQEDAVQAARRALSEALSMFPADEAIRLAAVAFSGGFADILRASIGTGGATMLIAAMNRELASAGVEIVRLRRH